MIAAKTTLHANDLPDSLAPLRTAIERAIPHGRSFGQRDKGAWGDEPPAPVDAAWAQLVTGFEMIVAKHPVLRRTNNRLHLGTLGTGNHFIEVCTDESGSVWFMLHSGSRGVGNAIGSYFIELAKEDMRTWIVNLPDQDLAYFPEGTEHFDEYVRAVEWAQNFAQLNREVMMTNVIAAARGLIAKPFKANVEAVNCHHNYVSRERHFGEDILVTRKGAVSAKKGELGIIPGSMGARSYIVRGLGNDDAFHSCSHGAGRRISRSEAKKRFTHDLVSNAISDVPFAAIDASVPLEEAKNMMQAMPTLWRQCFGPRLASLHVPIGAWAGRLAYVSYMWFDVWPTFWNVRNEPRWRDAVWHVLREMLDVP